MKQRLQIPLLLAALFLTSMLASAEDKPPYKYTYSPEGFTYGWGDTPQGTAKIGGGDLSGDISIPDSVIVSCYKYNKQKDIYELEYTETLTIVEIGEYGFENRTDITSVAIPNTVKWIDNYAFKGCTGLTSIRIPNSVTTINWHAFANCSNITYLYLEDGTESLSISSDNPSFYGCHIKNIYLGRNINSNFSYFHDLEMITIGSSINSINKYMFKDCTNLTSITIPNSVTKIGEKAFDNTGWYNNQPNGIIYLDNCCLGYKGYKPSGKLELREGTRLLAEGGIFSDCNDLTSITIPNSVTRIEPSTFKNCTNLTSVNTGNSVTFIGSYAFYGCHGLTSIDIPNSVTTIGDYAFSGCNNLTSLTLGNSITSIGLMAFNGCHGLTSIDIPNSVTTIGDYAFSFCNSLTKITIPSSVTSIGNGAFSDCMKLTSIDINCPEIGAATFYGCSNLISVTIGKCVTKIGNEAFYLCYNLKEVNISDLSAWCKIDFITDWIPAANPLLYGGKLILNGKEVKNLIIPNDITEIKFDAFAGCSSITSVTIPNSTSSIWYGAFADCINLGSVIIGNSMMSIEDEAFANCVNLTEIISLNSTPPYCEENVFDGVNTSKCVLKVPLGTKETYSITAVWKEFCNIVEIDAASIHDIATDYNAVEVVRYDIHGRKLSESTNGINIVKMSNGTTHKVIVK